MLISVKKVVKEILKRIQDYDPPHTPPKTLRLGAMPPDPHLITQTAFVSERQSQRQKQKAIPDDKT